MVGENAKNDDVELLVALPQGKVVATYNACWTVRFISQHRQRG